MILIPARLKTWRSGYRELLGSNSVPLCLVSLTQATCGKKKSEVGQFKLKETESQTTTQRDRRTDETDEHEQSGLSLCRGVSYSLHEVSETQDSAASSPPPIRGYCSSPPQPEDRTRPLQSTGLISELARRRLSYGTPYAWMDIQTGRAGVFLSCLHL